MARWIKIDTKIKGHWLWDNEKYLKWWLDILIMASWKQEKKLICNNVCTIERGQLVVSISFLRDAWKYKGEDKKIHTPTAATISRFLSMLEAEQMITINREKLPNRITLISVCNYDKYQAFTLTHTEGVNNTDNNTDNNEYIEYTRTSITIQGFINWLIILDYIINNFYNIFNYRRKKKYSFS